MNLKSKFDKEPSQKLSYSLLYNKFDNLIHSVYSSICPEISPEVKISMNYILLQFDGLEDETIFILIRFPGLMPKFYSC